MYLWSVLFFFFKQKTAYEMRISDWSSDVCSSDLGSASARPTKREIDAGLAQPWVMIRFQRQHAVMVQPRRSTPHDHVAVRQRHALRAVRADRKSVVSGKGVSVRVDLRGRRILKKKKNTKHTTKHACYAPTL